MFSLYLSPSLSPGRFFDKVIEKQFYGRGKPGSGRVSITEGGGGATGHTGALDRRRVLM